MVTPAQNAKIREIRSREDFAQDANDPETAFANRSKPSSIVYMYHTTDGGFHSIRIGTSGNLLTPRIS